MSTGRLTRYGLPYSNVVNTGIATNNITPGRTLEMVTLKLGGTSLTKAMIKNIKVKANGKVIVEASGEQLDAIMKYRGHTADNAFLDIPFADYTMTTEVDKMVGAFDTSVGIANITTEVDIQGATAPQLTPILYESAVQKTGNGQAAPFQGLISKLLRYPYHISTGGKLPVTVPFGPTNGSLITRLHVFHGGAMTGATVKMDGVVIHESVTAENEYYLKRHTNVPQTNVYTIDFVADGNIGKALNTKNARSLEWLFDFSAADSGTVLVEYLDPLGNL